MIKYDIFLKQMPPTRLRRPDEPLSRTRPYHWWRFGGVEIYLCTPCDGENEEISELLSFCYAILKHEQPTMFIRIIIDNINTTYVSIRLFFGCNSKFDNDKLLNDINNFKKPVTHVVKHYPSINRFKSNQHKREELNKNSSQLLSLLQDQINSWVVKTCSNLNLPQQTTSTSQM